MRDETTLAFIFGSRASCRARASSDWDIAVYFRPKEYGELETESDYAGEKGMWSDLVDIVGSDSVDLVILNRARPPLVYDVLREGLPLTIKDRRLYIDLLNKSSYEAMDWWQLVSEFQEIRERSKSLAPRIEPR